MPNQKYSSSVEIRTYLEDLAKRFGLEKRVFFRSQASGLKWDEGIKAWKVDLTMRRGPEGKEEKHLSIHADFALLASGLFPYPQVPRVPGLSDFKGEMFHTSRWNYDVTGGSYDTAMPELAKLKGERVGVIGTGATAIQIVPQLAKYAKELFVFQRTPSQVSPRGQRSTDPVEWRERIAAKPGWQLNRMENLANHISGHLDAGENLVDDNWSKIPAYGALVGSKRFGLITPDKAQEHIGNLMALDYERSTKVREHVAEVVKDKETAKKLTPWYPSWCKRPTFSDLYLQAFNNEHVHLIDTDGKGIEKVTATGIVANGQEYPIDVLVLSTGYRSPAAGGDPGSRTGIEIIGRDGRKMADKWDHQGICTLHGTCTNGFPNLFFQFAAQAGATSSYTHVLEVLSEHISSIIAQGYTRSADPQGKVIIQPTAAAEDAWGMRIAQTAAFFSGLVICTPSYINSELEAFQMPPADDQVAMMKKGKAAIWQPGLVDFTRVLESWRSDGKLDGFEVSVEA